jgi:hypothetical protein
MSPEAPQTPNSCPLCMELLRHSARETPPHASLRLLSSKPWAEALNKRAAGALEIYMCQQCGNERVRDTSPTYSARWM